MRNLKFVLIAYLLVACASPHLSDRAAKIQVHSQMSTLLDKCKNIGPVSASASDLLGGRFAATETAKNMARDRTADIGGDVMVVTNIDYDGGSAATVQAVALKCYQ